MRSTYSRVETTTTIIYLLPTPQDLYSEQIRSLCHTYRSKLSKIFYLPSFPDLLKATWAKVFFLGQSNPGTTTFTKSHKHHCSLIIKMKYINKNKLLVFFVRITYLNLSHNYEEFQAYFWKHFMQQGLLNQRILIHSHNTQKLTKPHLIKKQMGKE